MGMNWWRCHHGMPTDAKLALVAHRAGARKCEVGWIWVALLDRASQAEQRGSIDGYDCEEIGIASDIPTETVTRIIEVFRERRMLSQSNVLTAWDKRQPRRERDDEETSTDRVRRFRDKKRNETDETVVEHHETPCNATKHPDKSREEESREEEKNQNPRTADAALEHAPPVDGSMVRPAAPSRARGGKRTTEEIQKALGAERLSWWENFWRAYPCHDGMKEGMDAFERRVNTREIAVLVYKGAQRYAALFAAQPDMKLKYAQGWINNERWKDECAMPRPPTNGAPSTETLAEAIEAFGRTR